MRVVVDAAGTFKLRHDSYSPALAQVARAIPGCYKIDSNQIGGSSDAIEAAIKWLIEVRGLNADAFEGRELLVPKWLKK